MKAKQYLLGIDLGTSSTKAALYTTDGELVAQTAVPVPLYYPKPGVVEQENDDFYETAAQTIRQTIQQSGIDPRQIAALAFDSQMAGVGSIDENYQPATRFDSWLDMRCQPYIEQIDAHYGDLVTRLTGCPPPATTALKFCGGKRKSQRHTIVWPNSLCPLPTLLGAWRACLLMRHLSTTPIYIFLA